MGPGDRWLFGDRPVQADITAAVAWRFTQFMLPNVVQADHHPVLANFSVRAEACEEFLACPLE